VLEGENNGSGHVDKSGAVGNNGGPMLSKLYGVLITNSLFRYVFILTCDVFEDNYKL
jgi:hypothetical protein